MVTRRVSLTLAYHLMYQYQGCTNPMLIDIDDNPLEQYQVPKVHHMDPNGNPVFDGTITKYAHHYHLLGPPGHDDGPERNYWLAVWQPQSEAVPLFFTEMTCEHLGNVLRFVFRDNPTYAKHISNKWFDKIRWPRRREVCKMIYKEFKYRLRNWLP